MHYVGPYRFRSETLLLTKKVTSQYKLNVQYLGKLKKIWKLPRLQNDVHKEIKYNSKVSTLL